MHTFFENRGRIVLFIAVVTGIVLFSIYQKTPTALRGDIVNGYTIECGAEPPNTACSDIDNDSTLECCDDESDPVDGYCIDTGFDGDKCEDDRVKCFLEHAELESVKVSIVIAIEKKNAMGLVRVYL